MIGAPASSGAGLQADPKPVRLLGIFRAWRLRTYGGAVAALYVALLVYGYWKGFWLVGHTGVPLFSDFTTAWIAGRQGLTGHAALVYDPAAFVSLQKALVGPRPFYYPIWPYSPTYFLILGPIAALPYVPAFFAFEAVTLLGCIAVVYFVVRREPAIALVAASPFTAWNFLSGQSGLLTASLLGAALLTLERRPVLAGVFLGLLTYKPQFGILFPVALVAARAWSAIISAATTASVLVAVSMTAFGASAWAEWPRKLAAQTSVDLMADPNSRWGLLHTVYGAARDIGCSGAVAWLAQGATTLGLAGVVFFLWRSRARYPLKAAGVAAAALLATPYAFAYDMAAIVIPVAFLARDQIRCGLLWGEQSVMLALFAIALFVFPTIGALPMGAAIAFAVLCLVLRRTRQFLQGINPV
jgi:arabinofuranan 3-O-arabinosyltransferase